MSGIVLSVINFIMLFCVVRNEWVYRKRLEFIQNWGCESLDALPSFLEMALKFWIWNILKFIRD